MTWTTPGTAVAGQVLSAAFWNSNVRDNLKAVGDAWTSYSPTWGGITVGNGTNSSAYIAAGKLIIFRAALTLGTTSSVTGQISVTLPVTAFTAFPGSFFGTFQDSGTGWSPCVIQPSATAITLYAYNSASTYLQANITSSIVPHTWASTDVIYSAGIYQAA